MRAIPWLVFCAVYLATWFISTAVPTPLLWHLPLERRFVIAVHPIALGADFYGRLLLCLCTGALAGLSARFYAPKNPARALRLLTVWIAGLLIYTAGLYIFTLVARQPIPAPLPADYVPR